MLIARDLSTAIKKHILSHLKARLSRRLNSCSQSESSGRGQPLCPKRAASRRIIATWINVSLVYTVSPVNSSLVTTTDAHFLRGTATGVHERCNKTSSFYRREWSSGILKERNS
ncbi:MAG TPA: hypothetical protein VFA09_15785 [Ktedonobacteraceae bacterium]|nr:hypothetical protein [Ktedonobacteraceae bacterium]